MDEVDRGFMDSVLCVPGSRILTKSTNATDSKGSCVMFVNAGGEQDEQSGIQSDGYFQGGYSIKTDEFIDKNDEHCIVYETARFGNCVYQFDAIPPGNYYVDLFFAEIVTTNGPRGVRVFDIYIQEEKVVNELDVFSVVGANKPMKIVDINVPVGVDGTLTIRFEGIVGTPIINGICLRKPSDDSSAYQAHDECIKCNECSSNVRIPYDQVKIWRTRNLAKYEEQIKELKLQCQMKADECHEAWRSLSSVTRELEEARTKLDTTFFQNMSLDRSLQEHSNNLRTIESRYKNDRKAWEHCFVELEKKIKTMKENHKVLSLEAHECARVIPDLNEMTFAIQSLVSQYEDLKVKYNDEQMKRKELHNQLQEAKGNIRVFCRCRPLSKQEENDSHHTVIDFSSAKDGDLEVSNKTTKKSFKFDRVFTPQDDQATVYMDASPIVMSVLDGYNACIFAYGQTGTGKTFTMEGSENNRGVNYRTLEQLFQIIEQRKETSTYEVSVSVLEVYNEQIRDLLATSSTAKRLEVKQRNSGFVEARVGDVKEAWDVLQAGSNARVVGSNNVNERSSRSHCLLCTFVRMKNSVTGECTMSKLWLVDLAGSERLNKTEAQGERLKEAQNINRSLSALGDVISSLASKSSHIPYRNSKLTHLLQDSLGGDSKTLMFVQISPSENDVGETLSSLNFATRVRGVELGPTKKQVDTAELHKTKAMLEKAKQEVRNKEETMQKMESHVHSLEQKLHSKEQILKNQNEKVQDLEKSLATIGNQVALFNEETTHKENACIKYRQEIKDLENKLKEDSTNSSEIFHSQVAKLNEIIKEKEKMCLNNLQEIKQLETTLQEVNQNNIVELQSQMKEYEEKLRAKTHELEEQLKAKVMECDLRVKEIELKHQNQLKILQQKVSPNELSACKIEMEQPLSQINLNCSSVQPPKGKINSCEFDQAQSQSDQSHKVKRKSKADSVMDKVEIRGRPLTMPKRSFARIGKPTVSHSVGVKEAAKDSNKKQKVWLR